MRIRIKSRGCELIASLADTPTARLLAGALPFTARAQTWGEEVYFATPVANVAREPDARQVVEPGTVCFWTDGDALALPYGRTPISTDARPRLASPCNILGRLEGDPKALAAIRAGDTVTVEAA